MDELIDIVDEDDKVIGRAMKSEAHEKGLWHRTSHVWIYNSKGQVLLQLRGKLKMSSGGLWDVSAAGHVIAGEDVMVTAKRELLEELGVVAENLNFIKSIVKPTKPGLRKNNELTYLYFMKCDLDENEFTIQKEELDDLRWFDIDFVLRDLKKHPEKYVFGSDHWEYVLNKIKGMN
ncbi:MAG: NUDIX domain-containing protein [Nanoarchaeota archaeon]|nr:NUDIX domain-containing protein [Nanoarchaeota archaeon]